MALELSGWMRNRGLVAGFGGGVAALAALAVAPFWAAPAVGLAGFLALRWYFSPRGLFHGIERPERPQVALVREVLGEAARELARLAAAGEAIRDRAVARRVRQLAGTANEVCRQLERKPRRLLNVQRLLTFYLPSARHLAESYAELETAPEQAAEAGRLGETAAMLERLDGHFADYARRLEDPRRDALDVELRLLEQTLEEERGRRD